MENKILTKSQKREIIIQIGTDRTREICSLCHKKMDIQIYHIQLCRKCRSEVIQEIK